MATYTTLTIPGNTNLGTGSNSEINIKIFTSNLIIVFILM